MNPRSDSLSAQVCDVCGAPAVKRVENNWHLPDDTFWIVDVYKPPWYLCEVHGGNERTLDAQKELISVIERIDAAFEMNADELTQEDRQILAADSRDRAEALLISLTGLP